MSEITNIPEDDFLILPPGYEIDNRRLTRKERIIALRQELKQLESSISEEYHRSEDPETCPGA